MSRFLKLINSSVGKKIVMSLTGIFLCTFLVVHLSGNLLLFKSEEAFNAYSEFMKTNPVVRVIEIGLALFFFFHIFNGTYLWLQNKRARPKGYNVYKFRDNAELSSRIVAVTAVFVFLYLITHLYHFTLPARFTDPEGSLYVRVIVAFADPLFSAFYLISFILLGYHLKHGFQSAFQTLGLRDKKYTPLLNIIAVIFWFLVPFGYSVITVYFYWAQATGAFVLAGGQ